MAVVKWIPFSNDRMQHSHEQWAHILIGEPIPLLQELTRIKKSAEYMPCPAFVDYCRNTFVVRAPIDLRITINRNPYWISVPDHDQLFFDSFISARPPAKGYDGPLLLTMLPSMVFYTEDAQAVMMESMPPFLANESRLRGLSPVPGRFDVSKWVRPVDYTVEVANDVSEIEIKEGDALFYLRFTPEDGSKIVFERGEVTSPLVNVVNACTGVKVVSRNRKLTELYQKASGAIDSLIRRKL